MLDKRRDIRGLEMIKGRHFRREFEIIKCRIIKFDKDLSSLLIFLEIFLKKIFLIFF